MKTSQEQEDENWNVTDDELSTDEVLAHLEFGYWAAVVLIPILYYVNGPSVSHDQFLVRLNLGVNLYVGAPTLRFYRWKRRAKAERDIPSIQM